MPVSQTPKTDVDRFVCVSETTIDRRNGIPYASEGDKSYQAVEYSPNFHKAGSSLPSPQFG